MNNNIDQGEDPNMCNFNCCEYWDFENRKCIFNYCKKLLDK